MTTFPETRKKAQEVNSLFYFTGKPCLRNHFCVRYTKTGQCVDCKNISTNEWKEKNKEWFPEHCRKYARQRQQKNRNLFAQKCKEWRLKNPEKQKQLNKDWKSRNPESRRVHEAKRRALKKKSCGSYSVKDVKGLIENQYGVCVYCKESIVDKYHVDHKTPLSRGGSNELDNIQILCPTCNQRKYNKTHDEFLKQKGLKNEIPTKKRKRTCRS